MTETQQLIARLHAAAKREGKAPATISALILGSGGTLTALEEGRTITLAKYERAMAALDRMERAHTAGRAA